MRHDKRQPIRRHIFLCEGGERLRSSNLHFLINGTGPNIERTTENVRESQNVIHLVRIVRPACRDDGITADFLDVFRTDLRIRIRHGENDRIGGHGFHHFLGNGTLNGQTKETVSAFHGFSESSFVCFYGEGGFKLIHTLFAALIYDAVAVTHQDVLSLHAEMGDQTCAGKSRRTSAGNGDFHVFHFATSNLAGVDQACRCDDCRAVLVVVKNRYDEIIAQTTLNNEAFRSLDVLQIDTAKGRADIPNCGDKFLDFLGRHFDVNRVNIRKTLEKDRFALHDRL